MSNIQIAVLKVISDKVVKDIRVKMLTAIFENQ